MHAVHLLLLLGVSTYLQCFVHIVILLNMHFKAVSWKPPHYGRRRATGIGLTDQVTEQKIPNFFVCLFFFSKMN